MFVPLVSWSLRSCRHRGDHSAPWCDTARGLDVASWGNGVHDVVGVSRFHEQELSGDAEGSIERISFIYKIVRFLNVHIKYN